LESLEHGSEVVAALLEAGEPPSDPAALAELASAVGSVGLGLPASRLQHLRAFALDVEGDPAATEAWDLLAETAVHWPTLHSEALRRAAGLDGRDGHITEALERLDRAEAVAQRHGLASTAVSIQRVRARLTWRAATARANVDEALRLVTATSNLPESERASLLDSAGLAAWRAGWPVLAREICWENLDLAERHAIECRSVTCESVFGFASEDPSERAEWVERAAADAQECGFKATQIGILASHGAWLASKGRQQDATVTFERAEALVLAAGPRWSVFVQAARLADPGVDEGAVTRFDEALRGIGLPPGDMDHRGWLTGGYQYWIRRRMTAGAGPREVLGLVARREAVRWLPGGPPTVPDQGDLFALVVGPEDDLIVASSWSAAPVALGTDPPAPVLLDRAALEGRAWVLDGVAPPTGGSLNEAAGQLSGAADRAGPLLALGTGAGLALPAALLPIGDGPLGARRPTALWVPTTARPPRTWTSGTVLAAAGRPGAVGLLGVDELMTGAPAGWSTGVITTPQDVASAVAGSDVVHLSAHGHGGPGGTVFLSLGPQVEDRLTAEDVRGLDLRPGALVVLAACETGSGVAGELPPDLPMAAFQAGAGAVIFSRFPVRSRPLHAALDALYGQLPFACSELTERWHDIRIGYGLDLMGVEVAVSTSCLPR